MGYGGFCSGLRVCKVLTAMNEVYSVLSGNIIEFFDIITIRMNNSAKPSIIQSLY